MNSDPLQRRMFAQQILAQHARANQPMGILASSPQLMGAVQGYANGGAVKGYEAGGVQKTNIDSAGIADLNKRIQNLQMMPNAQGTISIVANRANQKFANVEFNPETMQFTMKPTDMEGGAPDIGSKDVIGQAEKQQILGKNLSTVEKEIKEKEEKEEKSNIAQVDNFEKGNVQPFVPEGAEIQEPGAVINNENKSILQTDKELKDNIPEGKNLGVKTGKDVVAEATKDYESWKAKSQKVEEEDKKFEASQDKVKDFTSKIETLMNKTDKPLSLDEAYKQAEKQLGVKEGRYDEDKMTAFWMAMIAGGAETAAGQSSNAFTNFAKGLKFGVQQFGKDLNAINKDEREDRKNVAKLSYELVKDDKSAKLAERTLKIQGYQALANLEEKKFQFRSEMEYKKESDNIKNEMARASLQLTAAKTFNDMALGKGNYDLRVETLALNKQKQKDYLINFQKELNQKFQLGTMSKEVKNVMAFGPDFGEFDDKGKFTLNDNGRKIVLASVLGKTKITDTMEMASAAGRKGIVFGSKYATEKDAKDAFLIFRGQFEPRIKVLKDLSKGLTGVDKNKYDKQIADLKQEFYDSTGAIGTVDGSSTGTINQNSITLPSNLIEQLNNQKTPIGGKFKTPNGKQYTRTGENTAELLE